MNMTEYIDLKTTGWYPWNLDYIHVSIFKRTCCFNPSYFPGSPVPSMWTLEFKRSFALQTCFHTLLLPIPPASSPLCLILWFQSNSTLINTYFFPRHHPLYTVILLLCMQTRKYSQTLSVKLSFWNQLVITEDAFGIIHVLPAV